MKLDLKLIAALVLVIVSAGTAWNFLRPADQVAKSRSVVRRELAMQVLGEYLATKSPGARVLVLSNPFTQKSGQPKDVYTFESAGVRGLKKGLGKQLTLDAVVYPTLNPLALQNPAAILMPPNTSTPLSYLTAEGAWDQILGQYPNAGVWVSLVGLPADLHSLQIWKGPSPKLALLLPDLSIVGDSTAILKAFQSGKLSAVVLSRPGTEPEGDKVEKDLKQEFDKRFVLVTAENAAALLQ